MILKIRTKLDGAKFAPPIPPNEPLWRPPTHFYSRQGKFSSTPWTSNTRQTGDFCCSGAILAARVIFSLATASAAERKAVCQKSNQPTTARARKNQDRRRLQIIFLLLSPLRSRLRFRDVFENFFFSDLWVRRHTERHMDELIVAKKNDLLRSSSQNFISD